MADEFEEFCDRLLIGLAEAAEQSPHASIGLNDLVASLGLPRNPMTLKGATQILEQEGFLEAEFIDDAMASGPEIIKAVITEKGLQAARALRSNANPDNNSVSKSADINKENSGRPDSHADWALPSINMEARGSTDDQNYGDLVLPSLESDSYGPRVSTLIYRVEHSERVSYNVDAIVDFDTPSFRVVVRADKAWFKMKGNFKDGPSAVSAISSFIEAWERSAQEARPEDEFRFVFERAITENDTAEQNVVDVGVATETETALPVTVGRSTYPGPPKWPGGTHHLTPENITVGHPILGQPELGVTDGTGNDITPNRLDGETAAELASALGSALSVLIEIRDTIRASDAADQFAQIPKTTSSTPGMGHNRPPSELRPDEVESIVEQGIESLKDETPNVARLHTVHAALRWLGHNFTLFANAFSTNAGATAGKLVVPSIIVYLAAKLPEAANLFETILTILQ